MHRGFAAELRRLIFFTAFCIAFGLMNGYLAWTLIIGGAIYMGWMLWQIRQLDIWLRDSSLMPPDASGIWGDIFDRISRLQHRQSREKERLRALIKRGQETTAALRDGIVLIDPRGNINWYNQSAELLLALQQSDIGTPLLNYIRHPSFIQYFESGLYKEALDLPSPQGGKHLQYQLTRFGQGERLLVVRDVSQIHHLEMMRKDFVANVSHELRTPLTVIKGYVETLSMSPDLAPAWQRALAQMDEQSNRMTALINDLLTLSRLETSNSEKEREAVAMPVLLSQVCADARVLASDKHQQISLECDESLALLGSAKELHSAISNLLVNAVKYSPEGANIQVIAQRSEKGATIAVVDNGPGIDKVHIPRLTERFYRVDNSRTSSTGGTGLGLAIVKHILLRHNGKLVIDSELGKGSRFTCVFPVSRLA